MHEGVEIEYAYYTLKVLKCRVEKERNTTAQVAVCTTQHYFEAPNVCGLFLVD